MEKRSLHQCIHGGIVHEREEAVVINVIFDEAAPQTHVILLFLLINRAHMAEYVLVLITGVPPITVTDHRMHPELCIFALVDEVGAHGRGDDISHQRLALGQVGGKVHLLPSVLLLDLLHAGEAEVLPHALALHEVDHAV